MGKNTQSKNVLTTREFSSGGVVFKEDKWLVTASIPSKLYPEVVWRLPKGWIDNETSDTPGPVASGKIKADENSLQKGALREVREEAGIEAKIIAKIGTEKYFYNAVGKGKILKFVTFYLMEWVKDLPEGFDGETSEVLWLPFDEALEKLSFKGEKEMLKKASQLLASVV